MMNSPMSSSPTSTMTSDRSPDMVDIYYLNELLNDRALLANLPKRFMHVERILDQEIVNVRQRVFDKTEEVKLNLPNPVGMPQLFRKKVYIPDGGHHFNYVGRLLGPRGKTLKGIEQDTGCKIMIRGAGSSRPTPPPAAMLFGNSTFNQSPYMVSPQTIAEDNDNLHVVIQCEDTPNRADVRISTAISMIEKLFSPVDSAHDVLKQKQLLELSILRGNFKPSPSPRRSNINLFEGGYFFGASPPCNFLPQMQQQV